jgi:hypothetical protein
MKTIFITTIAIVILMSAVTPVMAMKGYWTNNSHSPTGLRSYHLFLDGTYPSYVERNVKLLNQNLSVCLEFTNYTEPFVCHHINESEIPKANDSILDVGYFVVSDKLNETAATACLQLGYHIWHICNGQTIDANSFYGDTKILEHMAPTYDDVWVNDACITDHHLKEGTPEFHECEEGLS